MEELYLWNSFRKGDKAAFETLFNLSYKGLFRYGAKMIHDHQLIDDCIQDLFFELWTGKDRLPDVESVNGYLFRSLRYKLYRQARREARYDELGEDIHQGWETSYEALLINEEHDRALQRKLAHYVDQLSPRQREAITLRFTNQMSYEEISDVMSISYQAAVNLIYKSLKYLRENMVSLPFVVLCLSWFNWLIK